LPLRGLGAGRVWGDGSEAAVKGMDRRALAGEASPGEEPGWEGVAGARALAPGRSAKESAGWDSHSGEATTRWALGSWFWLAVGMEDG